MSTSRRFWRWATTPRLSYMAVFVAAVLINVLRLVVQNL